MAELGGHIVSGQARPNSMEEHAAWFAGSYMKNDGELRVIITDSKSGIDIGMVGGKFVYPAFTRSYYIGEEDFRKRGFATEPIRALIEYLSVTENIHAFNAKVKNTNISFIRCMENLGFIGVPDRDGATMLVFQKCIPGN